MRASSKQQEAARIVISPSISSKPTLQDSEAYKSDGLHLTSAGYGVLEARLLEVIAAHFPDMDPSRKEMAEKS